MRKAKTIISILLTAVMLLGVLPLASACEKNGETNEFLVPTEEVVYYSEYGAVGDGKTDDLEAIQRAHADANARGIAVAADRGKTYYIGGSNDKIHRNSALIKTNTYWQDAKFIIDDEGIDSEFVARADIFVVKSDVAMRTITELPEGLSLSVGANKLDMTFDGRRLLRIINDNQEDFIRSGEANGHYGYGDPRQEVILVDKDGNIDETTPVNWEYTEITEIVEMYIDDKPVTVNGGSFTTIVNNSKSLIPKNYTFYMRRGLTVERSNTTVKNVRHDLEYKKGNSTNSCPYVGFFGVADTNNTLIEDCIACGHNRSASYDLWARRANDITWRNVNQSNDITKTNGIYDSDYTKNITLVGCTLSRYDAHKGVCNVTIKDCELRTICLVGFGLLYVENVTKNSINEEDYGEADFIGLRTDYGAFWNGDIVIKDCVMNTNAAVNYMIKENLHLDWDYGYQCYMPQNVLFDNLTVNYTGNRKPPYPTIYVFNNINYLTAEKLEAMDKPLVLCKTVTIKNCTTKFGLTHNRTDIMKDVVFTVDGERSDNYINKF